MKDVAYRFERAKGALWVIPWAENVLRVRYSPSAVLKEKQEFFLLGKTEKLQEIVGTQHPVGTGLLSAQYDSKTELLRFLTGDSTFLTEAESPLEATEGKITQAFLSPESELLYGFGNLNGVMGLREKKVEIRHTNCGKRSPMFFSNRGYGILFNLFCSGSLDWSKDGRSYFYTGDGSDEMDYFLIYGPQPDEILKAYYQLTGFPALLPRKAFGYIQSKNRYTSQKEVLDTARRFRAEKIPLDGIVIDYKWWGTDPSVWNRMEWETEDWPDPKGLFSELHALDIAAAVSVWADFVPGTAAFETFNRASALLPPRPGTNRYAVDLSSREGRALYWEMIWKAVLQQGADSVWLDANEPEPGLWAESGGASAMGPTAEAALIYPLLDAGNLWENSRQENNRRVNTLSRAATAGIQRYGVQSWSGDIPATWRQLRLEVSGLLNFHACGLPFFSTDTGGYFGIYTEDSDKQEMFLRWLQFSCFTTIFRVHGRDCDKAPWCFGKEYEAAIVWFLRLREQLVPYIYTLAMDCALNGNAIVRALVFDYRGDAAAERTDDQFMLGQALMICPVTERKAIQKEVYLPNGQWFDFYSGKLFESRGSSFVVPAPQEQIPVFGKSGNLLILGTSDTPAGQLPEIVTVVVFTGGDAKWCWMEDDGESYGYERNEYSEIFLNWNETEQTLAVSARQGLGGPRRIRVILYRAEGIYGSEMQDYIGEPLSFSRFIPHAPLFCPPHLPVRKSKKRNIAEKTCVGHWMFLENEGAAISDLSGFFNGGALISCDWSMEGDRPILNFNGYTSCVDCGNDDSLNVSSGLTIRLKIKCRKDGVILTKGGLEGEAGYALCYRDGRLQARLVGEKTVTLSALLEAGDRWHVVELRWSRLSGRASLFLDGVKAAEERYSGEIGSTDENLMFGKSALLDENGFGGAVSEIEIFNGELDEENILS